jgi:N6-adenosine-specific RNA methylase IME4
VKNKLTRKVASLPAHVLKDRVVLRLTEAEKALSVAVGIDQVRLVMDVAAAQEVFAKRQQLGAEVISFAHTLKIRALSKLADLTVDLPKARGTRGQLAGPGPGRGKTGGTRIAPPVSVTPTLADLGITKKVASVLRQFRKIPPAAREAIAQGTETLARARRKVKAETIRRTVSLPDAKYRVIYADPPWSYNDKADEGSVQSGGSEMHYPSMSIRELCDLPIQAICEEHAVLFLWVTSPLLFECAAVIKAWGFSYKASFVWDKVKHNMGHYNSVRHEFLLLCTRGSCTPDHVQLFDSVQSIERTSHSTKPEEFRRIIDTLYTHGKRIELFARSAVEGWDAYGHQATEASA